jgi:hypothetical protein
MRSKSLFVMAAAMLVSISGYAGFTQPAPVMIEIDGLNGIATGDMVSARNSTNEFEFIGCGMRAFDDGAGDAFYTGFCQASLEEGVTYTCFTFNKALLDGIQMVADASFITFSWVDDGTGNLTCTRIGSSTQSFYLPKDKPNF